MKRILNEIAYWLLIIPVGVTYVIVDKYRAIKKRNHRLHIDKTGRVTKYNPYSDKW